MRGSFCTLKALVAAPVAIAMLAAPAAPQVRDRPLVTQSRYEGWLTSLSNWGRWGPVDEMGALNLITPEKRRAAAALVREGHTVSLAATAQLERTVDNPCPPSWGMVTASQGGATDQIAYPCIHGAGTTHLDGFAPAG